MDHTGGPEHNTQFKKTELKSFLSNLTTYYEMVPVMQLIYFRGTTALVALHTALTQRVSNPQSWARDNTAATTWPCFQDKKFLVIAYWLIALFLCSLWLLHRETDPRNICRIFSGPWEAPLRCGIVVVARLKTKLRVPRSANPSHLAGYLQDGGEGSRVRVHYMANHLSNVL